MPTDDLVKQKNILGIILCLASFLIYFLLKLPLDLSVVCTNENQGFAFIFGQHFLNHLIVSPGRGLFYVAFYAWLFI